MREETLLVHAPAYSQEEVLLGQEVIEELELKPGTFVEIRAATAQLSAPLSDASQAQSLDLRSRTLVLRAPAAASKGNISVSLIRSVAEAFSLQARETVILRKVTADDAGLDWVELSFKDQQLTRGDIWHLRRLLIERSLTVHVGKTISLGGIRAQVYRMEKATRPEAAGVLTQNTMLRFRSRSAAFVLLIQVSAEMGEFRTPPLWGVSQTGPWFHTGEADTLDEAIRLHDGEATSVRDAYLALPPEDQADLIQFLETL